jgi:phosphoribosylanthranilate isomerase
MLIKICGITRAADAEAAVEAGADALGFIFWPASPRCVTAEAARAIASALPPFVTTVGVFVDQPIETVNGIADRVRLGAVQLHGDERPGVLDALVAPAIKAVTGEGEAEAWPARVTLLLDASDRDRRGGTGRTGDWDAAAALARRRRLLLAGGLTPENVAGAIARVRPYGIDVSSGVESAPGVKDHGKIRALIAAARAAAEDGQ